MAHRGCLSEGGRRCTGPREPGSSAGERHSGGDARPGDRAGPLPLPGIQPYPSDRAVSGARNAGSGALHGAPHPGGCGVDEPAPAPASASPGPAGAHAPGRDVGADRWEPARLVGGPWPATYLDPGRGRRHRHISERTVPRAGGHPRLLLAAARHHRAARDPPGSVQRPAHDVLAPLPRP